MTAVVVSTIVGHAVIVGTFLWTQHLFRKDLRDHQPSPRVDK